MRNTIMTDRRHLNLLLLAVMFFATFLACDKGKAESLTRLPSESQKAIKEYWTPERLQKARPIELHPPPDFKPEPLAKETASPGEVRQGPGAPPVRDPVHNDH
jgi:hypothetical protein